MADYKAFGNPVCSNCCDPVVVPPGCSGKFSVYTYGYCSPNPGLAGADIEIRRSPGGQLVASGTSDTNGFFEATITPETPAISYSITATYKGFPPINVYGDGGQPGSSGPPRRVIACKGTAIFQFDSFFLKFFANGCGYSRLLGTSIEVYKSRPVPGNPFVRDGFDLIGSGITGDDGFVNLELSQPNTRGSGIVVKSEHPLYNQSLTVLDQFNGVKCLAGVNQFQVGVSASNYSDLPGVDLSPRPYSGNAKFPTVCCNLFDRKRPLPGSLNLTVGPYGCVMGNNGNSVYTGYFQADMVGVRTYFKDDVWHSDCGLNPYYYTLQKVCVRASWSCGGLGLTYSACQTGYYFEGTPMGVDCTVWREVFLTYPYGGIFASPLLVGFGSRIDDPLLEIGTTPLGDYTVTE